MPRIIRNLIVEAQTYEGNFVKVVLPVTSEDDGFVLAIDGNAQVTLDSISTHSLSGSFDTQDNAAGNFTIAPGSGLHSEIVVFSGSSSTRIGNIPTVGRSAGDQVLITGILPATSGVRVQITNGTSGGTVLFDYNSDGVTLSFFARLVFDGTAWQPQFFAAPAY